MKKSQKNIYIFSGTKTNIAVYISSLLRLSQIQELGNLKMAPLSGTFNIELLENESINSLDYRDRYAVRILYAD